MAYGTVKVDNIIFTNGGADQTITVSGIVQSISGDITATGTVQGATIIGTSTVSGATVTGEIGSFTSGVFVNISGATISGNTATFTSGVFALGTSGTPSISFSGDINTGIYSPGADQLALATNGTQRLLIDASGNVNIDSNTLYVDASNDRVGIGDNGPDSTLTVKAATGVTPFKVSGPSSEFAKIDTSGRLLVGTSSARANLFNTNASAQFQVEGIASTDRIISVISSNSDGNSPSFIVLGKQNSGTVGGNTAVASGNSLGAISFQGSDGAEFVQAASIVAQVDGTPGANDMPGRLVFSTTADGASSPTERMTIKSDGTILINTTTAVPTNFKNGASFASGGNLSIQRGASADFVTFYHFNSGAEVGSITNNAGTGTSYNTSSDYRLKENVTPVTDGITRLQQLKPSRFNFIADPDKTVDGFLAHEVQTIVPEAITGEKDAVDDEGNPQYQGIDQSKLVPLLTAALQEAVAKIESLEARVTALET